MTVYNLETVDGTAIDPETGEVVLLIADNLGWENEQMHLAILQEKLNRYFQFVNSGQIEENYPDAKQRGIRIDCVCVAPAPASTDWFADEVRKTAAPLNVGFNFQTRAPQAGENAEQNS